MNSFDIEFGPASFVTDIICQVFEESLPARKVFLKGCRLPADHPGNFTVFSDFPPQENGKGRVHPDFVLESPGESVIFVDDSPWTGELSNRSLTAAFQNRLEQLKQEISGRGEPEKVICFLTTTSDMFCCLNRIFDQIGEPNPKEEEWGVRKVRDPETGIAFIAFTWERLLSWLYVCGGIEERHRKLVSGMTKFAVAMKLELDSAEQTELFPSAPAQQQMRRILGREAGPGSRKERGPSDQGEDDPLWLPELNMFRVFIVASAAVFKAKCDEMMKKRYGEDCLGANPKRGDKFVGEYRVNPIGTVYCGFFLGYMYNEEVERRSPYPFFAEFRFPCAGRDDSGDEAEVLMSRLRNPLFRPDDELTHRFLSGLGFQRLLVFGEVRYVRQLDYTAQEMGNPEAMGSKLAGIIHEILEKLEGEAE